jgi:antirestriction protein ArdC
MKQSLKEQLESKIVKLIETVEDARSWKKPFQGVMSSGLPQNYYSNTRYKGINIFFLWMESIEKGYQTNNWLTLKQCNQLKARVNKGEKSTPVFFFKPYEVKEINTDTGELETKVVPILKSYRVFNIDQTTLKPVESTPTVTVDPIPKCKKFFESIDICEIRDGGSPYYAVSGDYISMPSINKFISSKSYYATLAHEYIHSTGHSSRLDRNMDPKRESYAYEELIAELGASFISAHLHIDAYDIQNNAKAYLKSWLKSLKNDPKYLYKAMSEASKAFEYIVDIAESNSASNNNTTTIRDAA